MTWIQTTQQFLSTFNSAKKTFTCATDGGLKNGQGTFGWVATGGKIHFLSGAGPVDGDPVTSSSTRSEWFGYASLLEALIMMDSMHNNGLLLSGRRPTMHTWIDNKAVADHIFDMLKPHYTAKREYPHDADIISHIQWLWTQLPHYSFTVGWVKSHQDKDGTVPFHSLPRNAQLNVLADSLATYYFQHGKIRPRSQPHFFPSAKVSLLVNKQRVTAQYSEVIRFHVNGTKHKRFLQSTHKSWSTEEVWNTIDLQGLGIAFKSLPKTNQHSTSKMMHNWWNTGSQREKITMDSTSKCPRCGHHDETTDHILLCQASSSQKVRYLELITLRKAGKVYGLISTPWDILYSGLRLWLNTGNQTPHISLSKYNLHPDQQQILLQAINEQHKIGWNYACRGYLSTKWVAAQYFGTPDATLSSIRQTWLRSIIKAIWSFTNAMWTHRNAILHGKESIAKSIRESTTDQRIRHHYSQQAEYAVSDHVIFDLPLQLRLKQTLRSKKHWLVLAGRYHPTTRQRKMGTQPLLQTYFAPKPKNATSSCTRRHLITCDRSLKPLTENTARQTKLNFTKIVMTTTTETPADTVLPI